MMTSMMGEDSSNEKNNNVSHGYQSKQELIPAKYVPVNAKKRNAKSGPDIYMEDMSIEILYTFGWNCSSSQKVVNEQTKIFAMDMR